ncbi:CLUMA_CG006719, isoform A [Clunio marinus]|uniref:CLUMA_CG006719, isoform A n=1 Tax=Clunio marinus TaxID=568069 RepID=A0A1J1HYK1_9DIPT|nr:CLUMA_CG006719, isoform A [Clunio marinus]
MCPLRITQTLKKTFSSDFLTHVDDDQLCWFTDEMGKQENLISILKDRNYICKHGHGIVSPIDENFLNKYRLKQWKP